MDDYEFGFWRKEGDPQGTPPPPPKVHKYVDKAKSKKTQSFSPPKPSQKNKLEPNKSGASQEPKEKGKDIPGFAGYTVYPCGKVYYKRKEVKPWGCNFLIYLTDRSGYEKQVYFIKLFDLLSYLFLSKAWHIGGNPKLKIQRIKDKMEISGKETIVYPDINEDIG